MVTCRVCGTENEPGALYCGSCGSALVVDATQTPSRDAAGLSEDVVVPRKQGRERTPGTEQGPDAAGGARDGASTAPVPVAPVTQPDGEPTLVCAACGTANELSRVYCRRCAKELRPPVAAAPAASVPPRRLGISPGFIAVAGLAVVILVVGAVLLGGVLGPGASITPPATPTATTTAGTTPTGAPTPSPEPTASAFVEGDVPQGQIVYGGGASNVDLFLINADGSGSPERLTRAAGPDRDAAFSPDGTRIVYASANGIRILTIGGDIEVVTSFKSDTNPFWSPIDDTLVFAGKRGNDPELEILRYVLGEDTVTPLTDNQVQDHDPVWSPDGTRIAWVLGADNQRELMTMDTDGNKDSVVRLTNDDENDVDPAFSPTGDRLVFASKRGDGDDFDLFLYDLATRNITQVTDMAGDEHDPAWSPGGRFVVFHQGPPGQEDLFILDLVENKVSPLIQAPQRQLLPAWH